MTDDGRPRSAMAQEISELARMAGHRLAENARLREDVAELTVQLELCRESRRCLCIDALGQRDQARARVQLLEDALWEFGKHYEGCDASHDGNTCTCGLRAAYLGTEVRGG